MKYTKIDQEFHLIEQQISDTRIVAKNVTKPTNHIFVVDVSYSMQRELPLIRKQLKNKLSSLMNPGDTISIIWFSGANSAGIIKEEVEVRSLKTLTDLHEAVDRWLRPVGLTAFLKPLQLTQELLQRIKVNRPNSTFSLIFLTDGYNNDCPWPNVVDTLKSISESLDSSVFVEYGYYADTQRLTEMASLIGGEKISCDGFDEFEPIFEKQISTKLTGGKKKEIDIDADIYDFAFSISPTDGVVLYNIENGKILINETVDKVYYFSTTPNGINSTIDDKFIYAAIYVLSDKLLNDDVEKLFKILPDPYHYEMFANAYGKQKLNVFKSSIASCISDETKRFPNGKTPVSVLNDDAYCVMNLLSDLGELDINFYPRHDEFKYNRIGRQQIKAVNENGESEQIDANFVDAEDNPGYPLTSLVWNENRANLSVLCKIDGTVHLPPNQYGISEIDSFKYRSYTLIKDGILNIDKLPIDYTKEVYQILLDHGINAEIQENYIILDLASLPLVNRKMVNNCSAKDLAKRQWELIKVQAKKKVYDYYRKQIAVKESKSYIKKYGQETALWLKENGITDYNGFSPKTQAVDSSDFYMSVNLLTKVKGLSSLPKVEDVITKMAKGDVSKPAIWAMSLAVQEYEDLVETDLFKSLSTETQHKALQEHLTKKSNEINKLRRELLREIAKIKFSLILSKKWFTEFKSFDEKELDLVFDNFNLHFTFEMIEKPERI